jgi:hypothetical protein
MFNPRQAVWTKELEVSCSTESEWVQPWIDRFVQDCTALLSRVQFAHVERAVALDCVLDCRALTMDGDRMHDIDDTLGTAAVGSCCSILTDGKFLLQLPLVSGILCWGSILRPVRWSAA